MAQRKKQSKTTTSTNISSDSPTVFSDSKKTISDAIDRIVAVQTRTLELYSQWTSHLLRLSFLVSFLALFQLHKAIQNYLLLIVNDETKVFQELVQHARLEIVNALLAIVLIIQAQTTNSNTTTTKELWTTWAWLIQWQFFICTTLSLTATYLYVSMDRQQDSNAKKDFPVSVVFYGIVTCAYSFMSVGIQKTNTNIQIARALQAKLIEEEIRRRKENQKAN